MKKPAVFILLFFTIFCPFFSFSNSIQTHTLLTSFSDIWIWKFLGRLHPLVVHFPVSLLIVALFLEVFTFRSRFTYFRGAINILVIIGSVSAVLGVVFGLLLSNYDEYSGSLLVVHKWLGIATAVVALVAWFLLYRAIKTDNAKILNAYRFVLFISVLGVSVAGHYGANITHGENYLSETMPFGAGVELGTEGAPIPAINTAALASDAPLTPDQEDALNLQVRTIFAHNCYTCHSSEKIKGGLRLDTKAFALKGGESGPVIVPGHPEKSELIRLISLPANDKKAMPSKGKKLSADEISLISIWIKKGAPWPDNAGQIKIFREAKLEPRNPSIPGTENDLSNPIDLFVNKYFKAHEVEWPKPVDDGIYIRRVYLDILGLIPQPSEVDKFLSDQSAGKRESLVKELLNRKEDYSQHWMTFWNDALRNDYTGTGYIDGGRTQITEWLYYSLFENKPYNLFVKELINPTPQSAGFIKGIKWRGTVNSSQRTEMQAAQSVSQVFLGLNLKCASCHNSFVSNIKLKDAYAFANIFADTSLEINRCDKPTGQYAGTKIIYNELGTIDSTATTPEKLKLLADYLIQPKNGRLYRTIVNRMWAQLLGRGLVEPVDVMDNEPWDQDLLDWLAYDFTQNGYDIKKLLYLIATSKTYQLPSIGLKEANMLTDQKFVFKGMVRKRMSAEQFTDAVSRSIQPLFEEASFNPYEKIEFDNFMEKNKDAFAWLQVYNSGPDKLKYLSHKEAVKKSNPRFLAAVSADEISGLKIKDKNILGFSYDNVYIKFKNVDLTGIDKVSYGYGTGAGGFCVIHIDSLTGENISVADLSNTGGWDVWKTAYAHIKGPQTGKHDLYFVFKTDQRPNALFDLVWINFHENGPIAGVTLKEDPKRLKEIREKFFLSSYLKLFYSTRSVRASTVNNNPLLASLGRPNRETVITNRPSQANLLQALEFTNGVTLNEALTKGSAIWKSQYPQSDILISNLYKKALGREPNSSEKDIAMNILGDKPSRESVQDLMWALVLLPEFQIIY